MAFGTERDIDEVGYEYLVHSARPVEPPDEPYRVRIGGPDCARPYDMALMNVSAMSFGALSGNALRALNNGARKGRFAHDTGEGGLTLYAILAVADVSLGDRLGLLRHSHQRRRVRSRSVRRQGGS